MYSLREKNVFPQGKEQKRGCDSIEPHPLLILSNAEQMLREVLLVHLELSVTVLKEGVDLLGGCDTSVDVGLGSLSTHLLRS